MTFTVRDGVSFHHFHAKASGKATCETEEDPGVISVRRIFQFVAVHIIEDR